MRPDAKLIVVHYWNVYVLRRQVVLLPSRFTTPILGLYAIQEAKAEVPESYDKANNHHGTSRQSGNLSNPKMRKKTCI